MKTVYVKIEFDDEEKNVVGKVANALVDFELAYISTTEQNAKPAGPVYRAASTLRDNLGSA